MLLYFSAISRLYELSALEKEEAMCQNPRHYIQIGSYEKALQTATPAELYMVIADVGPPC